MAFRSPTGGGRSGAGGGDPVPGGVDGVVGAVDGPTVAVDVAVDVAAGGVVGAGADGDDDVRPVEPQPAANRTTPMAASTILAGVMMTPWSRTSLTVRRGPHRSFTAG